MAILSLLAKLGLNISGFEAGLKSAEKSVNKFGVGLKNQLAGAFSAAAVVSFTKSIIDAGSEIKDMKDRLGLTAEEVQTLSLAAKLGGSDISVFASAIERMRKSVAAGKGLEGFGISREQLLSGDVLGVMRALGDDIEKLGLNAQRTKELFDVFGKGVGQLVPPLLELRNASKGTLFFTDKQVNDLDRAGDFFTKLGQTSKVIGYHFLKALPDFIGLGAVGYSKRFMGLFGKRETEQVLGPRPRIAEEDIAALEEQSKREEHMRQQDEALRLEQEAAQKKREQHMREQDEVLRQQRLQSMSPFERELFKHTQQLESINQTLNERGIVIRDMVE